MILYIQWHFISQDKRHPWLTLVHHMESEFGLGFLSSLELPKGLSLKLVNSLLHARPLPGSQSRAMCDPYITLSSILHLISGLSLGSFQTTSSGKFSFSLCSSLNFCLHLLPTFYACLCCPRISCVQICFILCDYNSLEKVRTVCFPHVAQYLSQR